MDKPTEEWEIVGYQDARGHRPVNEFLHALPVGDRVRVVRTIQLLKTYGVELGMPYRFVLLHAFSKKTRKTLRREIEVALRRMAEPLEHKE
jgi:phage-related protein